MNLGALRQGRKAIQTSVGVGVETGQQEPEGKALVSTGGIQADFTREVAFDLDTKEEKGVPGGENHMNKSTEASNYEVCLGPLGK